MTVRDPTFDAVYWLEKKQIRDKKGCASCQHRGVKGWRRWSCGLNCITNKFGFCRKWRFDEDIECIQKKY